MLRVVHATSLFASAAAPGVGVIGPILSSAVDVQAARGAMPVG